MPRPDLIEGDRPAAAPDSGPLIPAAFFRRPAVEVAPDLLGRHLVHGAVALRITEVEAYGGAEDSASHCRAGRTPRTAPMWGPGGHAYVYFCYGVHWMLNLVTGDDGEGGAVLVRACEVVAGLDEVLARRGRALARRGAQAGPDLVAGPGKVAQALGVNGDFNHHPLFRKGGLELRVGSPPAGWLTGPRVGIGFASEADQARPWRFVEAACRAVSRPRLH